MDNWERLQFGLAAAGTGVVMLVLQQASEFVFRQPYLATPGYEVPGVELPAVDLASLQRSWPAGLDAEGGRGNVRAYMDNIENVSLPASVQAAAAVTAPAPDADLGTRLAAADPAQGRQAAQVCASCHTFEQGGADRTGPGLWGVVGRKVASHPGFQYSTAFASQTGVWTYERLDEYLKNPAKAVPGNRMGFAGLRRAQERANVIAFLSTLGPDRPPYPEPRSQAAAGG